MAGRTVRVGDERLDCQRPAGACEGGGMTWQIVRRNRLIVYSFDVHETLEISGGPVTLQSLMDLRIAGHVVGICGNWAAFCQRVDGWQHVVSFISNDAAELSLQQGYPLIPDFKARFLANLKRYIPADDYVMVGNILGVTGASDDQGAAERAGWRFICEREFAEGKR